MATDWSDGNLQEQYKYSLPVRYACNCVIGFQVHECDIKKKACMDDPLTVEPDDAYLRLTLSSLYYVAPASIIS